MSPKLPHADGNSLADLLRRRAAQAPLARAYACIGDGDRTAGVLGHAELDLQAQRIAAALLMLDFKPGDRLLLAYESTTEFIGAFFGCLYAGMVAVPVPAAALPGGETPMPLPQLAAASGAVGLCCGPGGAGLALLAQPLPPSMRRLRCQTVMAAQLPPGAWRLPQVRPDAPALVAAVTDANGRHGVHTLTHADVLRRLARACTPAMDRPGACALGWLPVQDTVGLMTQVLQPLFLGVPSLLMSPAAVRAEPVRWLRAISDHRATISGGPGWAYELCVRKVGRGQTAGLDLGCWTTAWQAGDPVPHETLARFARRFAGRGFRREALMPWAGLPQHASVADVRRPELAAAQGWMPARSAVEACAAGT